MQTVLQDVLPPESSFVLCDANSNGFPIGYASQGFADLFGYGAADCVGKKCGALVGGPSVAAGDPGLAGAAAACGVGPDEVARGIDVLTGHVSAEVRRIVAGREDQLGFALLLNRKRDGTLFTCQLALRVLKHPALGWSYCIGVQSDVTDEVPVGELLKAAACNKYAKLLGGRDESMQYFESLLSSDATVKHLNEAAGEMWNARVSEVMHNSRKQKRSKPSTRSLASRSTASGCSSRSSRSVSTVASGTSSVAAAARPKVGGSVLGVGLASGGSMPGGHLETPTGGYHLGSLLGQGGIYAACAATAPETSGKREQPSGRFLDLLEAVEGTEQEHKDANASSTGLGGADGHALAPEAVQGHPPWSCDSGCDPALKKVVDEVGRQELWDLNFPFMVIDPSLPGCPLVTCSAAYCSLTDFPAPEVVGQKCGFFLDGLPEALVDEESRSQCYKLLHAAQRGEYYPGGSAWAAAHLGSTDEKEHQRPLPNGEFVCLQPQARRSGELFRCMIYLKQVELDDHMFVIGLLAQLPDPDMDPEEHDRDAASTDTQERYLRAFDNLSMDVDRAVQVLASEFWYSAPMRRQVDLSERI